MIHHRLRVLLAVCVIVCVCCGGSWVEDGKPAPDNAWAKTDGELAAQLVLTTRPDELIAQWAKPGPVSLLNETARVVRGKPIVGLILFTGCAPDVQGTCTATLRFSTTGPDGRPYGKPRNGELWIGKAPPPRGQMRMGVGNIGVIIEPQDSLGSYTVVAEVLDKVSKKILVLRKTFEAVEVSDKK